ncbi:MAG: hypothetical protein ABUL68_04040, partial [Pseudomonadota bacterium]
ERRLLQDGGSEKILDRHFLPGGYRGDAVQVDFFDGNEGAGGGQKQGRDQPEGAGQVHGVVG